jgi:hypothetical protein
MDLIRSSGEENTGGIAALGITQCHFIVDHR